MSLFKGIVPSALTLSFLGLVACGSVDNDPPKLESVFGTVSAMDTLVAVFDKSIEDFDDSLVTSNQPITVVKQKGKKIYIVGATDTLASIPRFAVDSDYDTLKFANIQDEDGNKSKLQTVTFSTYPFLDSDEYEYNKEGTCYSNKKPADADVLTRVDAGAALADQDVAGQDLLAVRTLHAQALRRGIAAVFGAAYAFFMCHCAFPP